MPIDADEVRRIAALAQLDLDDAAVEDFRHRLGAVLDTVAALAAFDLEDAAPAPGAPDLPARPRGDEPRPSLHADEALGGAPDAELGHFRVPRVLRG